MRKHKNNKLSKIKKIIPLIIIMMIIYCATAIITYASEETVSVVIKDSNLYNELKIILDNQDVLHSASDSTKTIEVVEAGIPSITEFDLSNCDIQYLDGIENFTSLKNLDLSHNSKITDITLLGNLTKLTDLNLSYTGITNLSSISNLVTLTSLNANHCNISSISNLSKLISLTELDLSNNTISDISVISENLVNLRTLNLSYNYGITNLDDALVSSLESLNMSATGITKIKQNTNDELAKITTECTGLKELYLASNNITDWSNLFVTETVENERRARLYNLEVLDMNDPITRPGITFSTLAYVKNLKKLSMQNNSLTSLSNITNLEVIEELDLSNNNITDIKGLVVYKTEDGETYVSKTTTATRINLHNNRVSDISVLKDIADLTYLDLSGNQIQNIEVLERFSKLKETNSIKLQNQVLTMDVYKKQNKKDQYMLLYDIMQRVKNSNSIVYYPDATFETTENIRLNQEEQYMVSPYYNVIIPKELYNTSSNTEMSITVHGGIIDGTTITFKMSSSGIDSLLFKDEKISQAIYQDLEKKFTTSTYIATAPKILNVTRSVINQINSLDLSSKQISDIEGLSNFTSLTTLNLSDNNISSDSEIQYLSNLKILYLSNNKLNGSYTSIEGLKNLTHLYLSGNNISSLDSLQKMYENVKSSKLIALVLSSNNILDIDVVSNFTTLTTLDISVNKVSDISPIENLKNIETLNVSGNNLQDIDTIKNLTNLRTLDISQNDISSIDNIITYNMSLLSLNISGNIIQDISCLNTQTNLSTLNISNNNISDVSVIQSLGNLPSSSVTARQQKLSHILSSAESSQTQLEIDLPEIFNQARNQSSKIYTSENFTVENAVLSDDKESITINPSTINETGVARVTINGGNARGTTFTVAMPLNGMITYNPSTTTKENVTATITFNREGIKITNNSGSNTYVFTDNDSFTFEYEDEEGTQYKETARVTWIDRTTPIINVGYSETSWTQNDVTVTITSNEQLQEVTGWTFQDAEHKILTKTYSANTSEEITVKDIAGNEAKVVVEVKNIDRQPPEIIEHTTSVTATSITARVTSSDDSGNISRYVYEIYNGDMLINSFEGTTSEYTFNNLTPETTYSINITVYDEIGNHAQTGRFDATTNPLPPVPELDWDSEEQQQWHKPSDSSTNFEIDLTKTQQGEIYQYSDNGGTWTNCLQKQDGSWYINVTVEGIHKIRVRVSGLEETSEEYTLMLDYSVPEISIDKETTESEEPQNITISVMDRYSGLSNQTIQYQFSTSETRPTDGYIDGTLENGNITITTPEEFATYYLYINQISDNVGNVTEAYTFGPYILRENIPVTGIEIEGETAISMEINTQKQLTAIITPENALNQNVIWSSSNTDILEVDENGIMSAKAVGTVTVTATSEENQLLFDTCEVTVINSSSEENPDNPNTPGDSNDPDEIRVTSVKLNKENIQLKKGEKFTLVATVSPENATNKNLIWTSSNRDVVTVSGGVVTAISAGNATITVKTEDGGYEAKCTVRVTNNSTTNTQNNNSNNSNNSDNSNNSNNNTQTPATSNDRTTSNNVLPKTGIGAILVVLVIVTLVSVVIFVQYRKLKDIK